MPTSLAKRVDVLSCGGGEEACGANKSQSMVRELVMVQAEGFVAEELVLESVFVSDMDVFPWDKGVEFVSHVGVRTKELFEIQDGVVIKADLGIARTALFQESSLRRQQVMSC